MDADRSPGSMRPAAPIASGTNNESEGERGRVEVSGDHPIARSMRPSPECLADIAEMEAQNAANVRALLRGEHASAPPAQPQEEWRAVGLALLREANLLLQQAEGCAVNHYGGDHELHGLPGWLVDSRSKLEAAAAFFAPPKTTGDTRGEG